MKLELTIVRFARHHDAYNTGELAGFLPARARQLIAEKLAAYVSGPVPEGVTAKEQPTAVVTAGALPYGASGPTDQPEERARREQLIRRVQGLSVAQAVEAIKGMDGVQDLEILQEGEVLHPEYQGGRKGVLDAIAGRVKALQAEEQERLAAEGTR